MNSKKNLFRLSVCLILIMVLFTGCVNQGKKSNDDTPQDQAIPAASAAVSYEGNLRISYLDVGQGDSTFIEFPDGTTMLIDGGEAENAESIMQYIRNQGHDTLDYVVATHPHSDHIGGLPTIIDRFKTNAVYMPKTQNNTSIFEKLLTSIQEKGLKIKTAKAGVNILTDDHLSVDIVAPVGNTYADLNDYSAVLKITYGNTSFLFMGDAEQKSENEITADINADVLKVGHHGSHYSSSNEFLNRVSPKYAVISCGVDNQYGHPEPQALDRLNAVSAEIYRTDLLGTVVFQSDGNAITVDKSASPQKENAPPAPPLSPGQSVASTAPVPAKYSAPVVSAQNQTPEATVPQNNATTVYITNSGSKYHMDGCQSLRQSKIPISLDEARTQYDPCSKCNPPQ